MAYKAKHVTFAWAVAAGKSNREAALEAGYAEKWASSMGSRLSKVSKIRDLIRERQETLARVAGLDKNWLIDKFMRIAEARADDIASHRRVCCRHCYGVEHHFQWTEREYARAVDLALDFKDDKGNAAPKPIPDGTGGFGYDAKREPFQGCPECHGAGVDVVFLADSRKLKGSAQELYAGVKQTKNGIEVKLRDQDHALRQLADYLGLGPKKLELSGPDGKPIEMTSTPRELTDAQLTALAAAGLSEA